MKKSSIINYLTLIWSDFSSQKGVEWNNSFLQWEIPPGIEADFALNLALPISHKTKCPVEEVAQQIVNLTDHLNYLKSRVSSKGYINYWLTTEYYTDFLAELVLSSGKNLLPEAQNIRVSIEYISANPTGYLHLGNLRSGIVGDALANIYEFMGYRVTREYYINDRGEQIKNLINSVYYFYHILQKSSCESVTESAYSSKSSREAAEELINKWGNKYLNKNLGAEEFSIWKEEILQIIISKIKQELEQCGIKYDKWVRETSFYRNNHHLSLIKKLKEKDLIYEKEGAVFLKTSLFGDEKDRAIIKGNKDYTYFFSDILYHLDKFERSDFLINFWGADHHGYTERVKVACQLLGYNRNKISIILTQIVNLLGEDGQTKKFSKRAGTTINITEALAWLGKDQLRFAMLEKEPAIHLTINKEILQKEKEKSRLYYLQYAHARCCRLLERASKKNFKWDNKNNDLCWSRQERKILINLIRFPSVLQLIIEENKPHHLVYQLLSLAQEFQNYYQNNTIILEDEPLKAKQRILLTKGVKIILQTGLNLLGLASPSSM